MNAGLRLVGLSDGPSDRAGLGKYLRGEHKALAAEGLLLGSDSQ